MGNILGFVIAFLFFLGGLVLFGFAFTVPSVEALLFVAGIACVVVSLAIPFHILGHGEQR